MNNKQPQTEKTTDTVRPQKSTETSKVVLNHHSVIDNVSSSTKEATPDKSAHPNTPKSKRIVISPISSSVSSDEKKHEPDAPTDPPSSLDEVKLPEDNIPPKTSASQIDGPDQPTDETRKAVEAAAKRERELQEYIDSHQFFVPINAEERKRSIKVSFGLTFLLFVLGVLLIDLMLDSGIIELIQKIPHTHFFTS